MEEHSFILRTTDQMEESKWVVDEIAYRWKNGVGEIAVCAKWI
jgi:hypothetical protein